MLAGKFKDTLDATVRMKAIITEEILRLKRPALMQWMQFFKAVRVHVLIRFGMWGELMRLEPLEDEHPYCVTNVMRYYGKGIAYAATCPVEKADEQRKLFKTAATLVPPSRLDFPNRIIDILPDAAAMLDGEIEYRRGNYGTAFNKLRDAIALEDAIPFAGP